MGGTTSHFRPVIDTVKICMLDDLVNSLNSMAK
jgi:hypothetical protein